jgi:hypothetical protein
MFIDGCFYLSAKFERKLARFMQAATITAHDRKAEKTT